MAKPCDLCGGWIERVPDGRAYNDDGTWHNTENGSCRPDPKKIRKRKVERADFAAEHMKIQKEPREDRGYRPLFGPRRKS